MSMRLLQEWTSLEYTPEMMAEAHAALSDSAGKRVTLRGILQKADTLNQNGRIYPRAILEREVRNYQKFIRERRSIGELDHPSSSVVELKNGSHVITSAYMEGDDVIGTIEVLSSVPMGKVLLGYIEAGIKVGISSRGVGSTQQREGHQVVNDDFQLICWDIVAEPSTSGAFMIPEGHVIFDAQGRVMGYPSVEHKSKQDRIQHIIDAILSTET